MLSTWIALIFVLNVKLYKADEVEDLKNKINAFKIDIATHKKTAHTQYQLLKKAYADVWTQRTALIKDMNIVVNAGKKKVYAKRTEMEAKTDWKKSVADLSKKAENLVENKMKDFAVKFDEYKAFYDSKHAKWNEVANHVKTGFDKILNIETWITESMAKLNNATLGDADVTRLQKELHLITRQVQLQQFNEEEKARSDGNSGIKQIRTRYVGAKNYFSNTHNGNSFSSIHDHTNNERTCGLGEFVAVLNGVEFRTRHNDFRLKQAAVSDTTFHATQDVPFPEVPDAVKNAGSVAAQTAEMVAWFKAFKDQDHTVRDYRKYFKPVLCYLEGAWTNKNGGKIDEPFDSDRHHIDAKSWFDLQEKIMFTSYSGTKSKLENLAHLPTTIMNFNSEGKPVFAQWNYRILCHPLKKDIPTKYLKLVLDPASQKMMAKDNAKYETSRAAKFDIEGVDINGNRKGRPLTYTVLDSLMEEIPGKDNYGASITAAGFDSEIMGANPQKRGQSLNGAYYHRPYKLKQKDAMGVNFAQRGYADRLYVALTTQDKISAPVYRKGETISNLKVSYAIPIEMIYLTPLSKWNPYNIEHKTSNSMVTGKGTKDDPFSNTVPKGYYRTPDSFFTGPDADKDAADTTPKGAVYVNSGDGKPVAVHASGTRIKFPPISGIEGVIRQRYPIMPIYGEGSSVWKKLNAMEDNIDFTAVVDSAVDYYSTGISHVAQDIQTTHTHILTLDKRELTKLKSGEISEIKTASDKANGHIHTITVAYTGGKLVIKECGGKAAENNQACFDKHGVELSTSSAE